MSTVQLNTLLALILSSLLFSLSAVATEATDSTGVGARPSTSGLSAEANEALEAARAAFADSQRRSLSTHYAPMTLHGAELGTLPYTYPGLQRGLQPRDRPLLSDVFR